jgi:hypothetical protein
MKTGGLLRGCHEVHFLEIVEADCIAGEKEAA